MNSESWKWSLKCLEKVEDLNEGQLVEWGGRELMDLQGSTDDKSEVIEISYEDVWQIKALKFSFEQQTYSYLMKNMQQLPMFS